MELAQLITLVIAAFVTSSISAVIGMGGGIILLGIMAVILPDGYLVIALHGVIQLVSNTTRTIVFKKYIRHDIIKDFSIGALVGMVLSILIIIFMISFFQVNSADQIKTDYLKPVIGIFILWYLLIKIPKTDTGIIRFYLVGGISGLSSVFVGATGPLIAPFFIDKKLTKESLIANKAACQTITHITKIPIFMYFFSVNYFKYIDILLPLSLAVFIGTNFGKIILGFIPEKIFIIIFKTCLAIIAVRLVADGLL